MTTAREAIAKAYKEFEEAFYNGEADTISRMDTEDAELLIPEAPIVRGREAIGQVWASILVRIKHAGWQRSQRWQIYRDMKATIHGRKKDPPRHLQLGHSTRPDFNPLNLGGGSST